MGEDDVIDVEAQEVEGEGVHLPVVAEPTRSTALVARDEIDVSELVQQSKVIEEAMRLAMTDGIHYGRIPGVNKPTLLKPGAEKLLVLFRLAPEYDTEKIWHEDGHLTVMAKCSLRHIPTGLKIAEGEGLCTTRESRYAWRKGERVCPECNEPQVREGKARDGRPGNWYCWKKQGGCGATWDLDSEQGSLFRAMETGRVANPDLPDTYNTVLKMGDKRALLAAVLNGTAASDVFTQDMEDTVRASGGESAIADRQEPKEEEKFDPATSWRKDAPAKRSGWKGIGNLLSEIDPSIDWKFVLRQAIAGVYGGDGDFRKLEEPMKTQAGHRAANAAGRLSELFLSETFVSVESIQKAFAEMFDGVVVDVGIEPAPLGLVDDKAEG